MLKQTLAKYKTISLGNGTGSIHDFGCYLVSLCDGLNRRGYLFSPEGLNTILKEKGLWIGEFGNYIDVDNLDNKWGEIFTSFVKIEPFSNQVVPIDDNHIVLAKVNAKGIGGSGTHFVEVLRMDGVNAIIGDPWYGDEIQAFSRYGKLGTLLGLRIFEIKKSQGGTSMADTEAVTKLKEELEQVKRDRTSLTSQVEGWVRDSQNGTWVAKADVEKREQDSYKKGFEAGKASVIVQPELVELSKWEVNGLTISTQQGSKTTSLNYKLK